MISDDENKRYFDEAANNLDLWILRANDLFLASCVLMERIDYEEFSKPSFFDRNPEIYSILFPAIMLRAFSVECFLKALWISKGNKVSTDGTYKIDTLKKENHDLVAISSAVGFTLCQNQKEVLHKLSKFGQSFGRYPIARRWHDQRLQNDEGGIPHVLNWDKNDTFVVDELIERIKKEIYSRKES
ncbi:MAG: hypothetical protein UZ01_00397 [Candidatus Brocadia sinica]|nr:MAG: hypothetical protein UZ01_00397 [Candidatus Brocadia sinica]NUO10006.1 hypothetical protein [Candidatus Brocadia sp.]